MSFCYHKQFKGFVKIKCRRPFKKITYPMKNTFINLMLCLVLLSCTSNQQQKQGAGAKKSVTGTPSAPFDLADLTLKEENFPSLMTARGLKPEPVADGEQTLFGYEVFKSSSPQVLRYKGAAIRGSSGNNKNRVLFHYNKKSNVLAFYEVKIYTQQQADALLSQLQKMGKPAFEKLGLAKGEIAIDLVGNEIPRGKEEKQTYRVWENKNNGLSYFYGELGSGADFNAELTVLNRSGKYAKDWLSFTSLDWYKHN
jgi:hypothetical protein